jgi:hypothetical protein
LRNYNVIRHQDVYPGIDWLWHFQEGALEFQFQLGPGADPAAIRMEFTGANEVRLDRDGNLDVDGGAGLQYRRPKAWQDSPTRRIAVPIAFRVDSGVVTFDVGQHDSRLPLTIDPVVKYSRYLGGAGYDAAYAVATDAAGSVYVTGETSSVDLTSSSGVRYNRDAFVSKLSPDGSQTVYTVLLSSDGNDAGKAIAIDGGGNIWVAGVAGGSGFPTTLGALSSHSSGVEDAFVAQLDSNGVLKYSTYLGGGGTDVATALAIDSSGSAYVAGYTTSVNFPTTPAAPQTSYQGGTDAFLVKLSSSGGFLSYSTLLGGSGNDSFNALSVDAGGTACAAGQTSSSNLPVRNAVQATYGGNGDAMLACLNPTGTAWSTLTYLGGSGLDEALGMARDTAGNIYVTGDTYSYNFPTSSSAYRRVSASGYDAFAVKLNATGTAVVFATLLGGSGSDSGTSISVDVSGNVWTAGYTASVDFPVTGSPGFGGYFDGFLAEISADGSSLVWAGYLGGSGDDRCLGMTLTATGDAIVVGLTGSADFPITVGASPTPYNAFVMRVAVKPPILSITKTHTGNFTQGQSNAVYTVIVSNEAGAGTTSGMATVTETVPTGLTLVSMAGTGWTCLTNTCTRSDPLSGGSSYSPITVAVNVASDAASQVTNQVAVSGGGSAAANAGDLTTIGVATCSYSVNPTNAAVASGAGTGTVSVITSAGCSWNAVSNATSWLNVTPVASGSGSATLGFSYITNPNPTPRSGMLTVGAQTFTLTQVGAVIAVPQALRFVPLTPCRIADTRNAAGPFGGPNLSAGVSRDFNIPASSCGIPVGASAYSLNITVVPLGLLQYISVWPTGQPQPVVSTLNSFDGRIKANAAIVPAGLNGAFSVFATNPTHVVIDIDGYFVPASGSPNLAFYPVPPCRVADTRNPTGTFGAPSLARGVPRTFPVPSSSCGIPASAQAYALNMTVVPTAPVGYLTTWPAGSSQPVVSTLNAPTGTVTSNAAIVPAGVNGAITVYATNATDLLVDINGYFAPPGIGSLDFYTATPCRVLDTRNAAGPLGGPILGAVQSRSFIVSSSTCGIPSTAKAYSLNATVVPAVSLQYLSLWGSGSIPIVSTLNSFDGSIVSNAALVRAGASGEVTAFTTNLSHLLVDINGYFQ